MIIKVLNRNKIEKNIINKTDEEIMEESATKDNVYFKCSCCGEIGNRVRVKFQEDWKNDFICKSCKLKNIDVSERNKKGRETQRKNNNGKLFFQTNKFKEKTKQSYIERYGVESHNQLEEVKRKKIETSLKKYGVENVSQSLEIKEKIKKTNLERHGVDSVLKLKRVRDLIPVEENYKKLVAHNLKNYGGQPINSAEIKEKIKKTNLERHGVENTLNLVNSRNMRLLFSLKQLIEKCSGKFEPMFKPDDYIGKKNNVKYKWKCCECGNTFEDSFYSKKILPRCKNCNPFLSGASRGEKEVYDFVKSLGLNAESNYRDELEIDIYIPELNLGIEYDGLYWHNESNKGKDYHKTKKDFFKEKGIEIINIYEDEWENKKEIVKSIISNKLGKVSSRIYARECDIKKIDFNKAKIFLDENHIQGGTNSPKFSYGLFYNEELISVMTFGKSRFNKNYDWELVRFANKINYNIIGGASKLLKKFQKENEGTIISYCDFRYFSGTVYDKLGFKILSENRPNFNWVKNSDRFNRERFNKKRIENLFPETFNKDLTEYENMKLNGFDRIWDCGSVTYVKL